MEQAMLKVMIRMEGPNRAGWFSLVKAAKRDGDD